MQRKELSGTNITFIAEKKKTNGFRSTGKHYSQVSFHFKTKHEHFFIILHQSIANGRIYLHFRFHDY